MELKKIIEEKAEKPIISLFKENDNMAVKKKSS